MTVKIGRLDSDLYAECLETAIIRHLELIGLVKALATAMQKKSKTDIRATEALFNRVIQTARIQYDKILAEEEQIAELEGPDFVGFNFKAMLAPAPKGWRPHRYATALEVAAEEAAIAAAEADAVVERATPSEYISVHLLEVFEALQSAAPQWLTAREIGELTPKVAPRTVRAHIRRLVRLNLVDQAEGLRVIRYRFSELAEKHNKEMLERFKDTRAFLNTRKE
jgi:DNA-binding transcriptional ArsR family regulator